MQIYANRRCAAVLVILFGWIALNSLYAAENGEKTKNLWIDDWANRRHSHNQNYRPKRHCRYNRRNQSSEAKGPGPAQDTDEFHGTDPRTENFR